MQRQNAIEKKLGCKFIRINYTEQSFNIFKLINKMQKAHKKIVNRQDFKKIIMMRVQFKCLKYAVKKYCHP